MTRRSGKRSKGALALIGGLLLASAFLRIGLHTGEAIASQPKAETNDLPAQAQPLSCETPADHERVIALMTDRETRLKEREQAFEVRLKALDIAEKQIAERLATLVQTEERLSKTIALAKGAAADDVTRLTEVYTRMKPKQAAALFEEMAPDFAAGFLGEMSPDAAAAILAGMTPQSAYTISVVLAGRNANIPKE